MKKLNIQYISYSGNLLTELFKVNTLNLPESFDDYEINILDLSDENLWKNKGNNANYLDCFQDVDNIGKMINNSDSKILIVLPQNIEYNYGLTKNWGGNLHYNKIEFKNKISILDNVINIILGTKIEPSLLMYNKTKSKIDNEEISCDFVFKNVSEEQIITKSVNGRSITTINVLKNYITTLNLKKENNFFNFLKEINWIYSEENDAPEWIENEKIFNDVKLESKKVNILVAIDKIN